VINGCRSCQPASIPHVLPKSSDHGEPVRQHRGRAVMENGIGQQVLAKIDQVIIIMPSTALGSSMNHIDRLSMKKQ
jgi:hypothetical protein